MAIGWGAAIMDIIGSMSTEEVAASIAADAVIGGTADALATDAMTSGTTTGLTDTAATPAVTDSGTAALDSGTATSAAPAAAPSTTSALASDLVQPAGALPTSGTEGSMDLGQFSGGPGSADVATQPDLIDQLGGWAEKNKMASLVGSQMIGGIGKNLYESDTQQKKIDAAKALAEQEATAKQRQTMGNPSVGGSGVAVPITPGSKILRRPDGTIVFAPGSGIINTRQGMTGIRG